MKNAFYFMLKTFFVHQKFTFLSLLFGYAEKRLDKKDMLDFKFMTPQMTSQIITMHVLPNILSIKSNKTMKFAWLIEYNMRNIFLEK